MSSWFTYGDTDREVRPISWIQSDVTQSSFPKIHIKYEHFQEKKPVKHFEALSKKNLEKDEILRTLKVRIKPTEAQKNIFHKIFGTVRFVYNIAVDRIMKGGSKPKFRSLKKVNS